MNINEIKDIIKKLRIAGDDSPDLEYIESVYEFMSPETQDKLYQELTKELHDLQGLS